MYLTEMKYQINLSSFNKVRKKMQENLILAPIWAGYALIGATNFLCGFSSTRCLTLSQAAILCNINKTNDANLIKWRKKPNFEPSFGPCAFHFVEIFHLVEIFATNE